VTRPDGKLFQLLDDDPTRDLLQVLARERRPLTQRQLGELLNLDSGTVSRRMSLLEDFGVVERKSSHAPYALVFPKATRAFLGAAHELTSATLQRKADAARFYADELQDDATTSEADQRDR
jgi:DNA-binding IclR family transcriptional regulator